MTDDQDQRLDESAFNVNGQPLQQDNLQEQAEAAPAGYGQPAQAAQDWQVNPPQPQSTPSPARAEQRHDPNLNLEWPAGSPLVDAPVRRGFKASKFIVGLLVLGLLAVAGWYYLHHQVIRPKRLAGMGQIEAPADTATASASSVKRAHPGADSRQTQAETPAAAPIMDHAGSGANSALASAPIAAALSQAAGAVVALASVPTGSAAQAAAPASSAAMDASPEVLAAASAMTPALPATLAAPAGLPATLPMSGDTGARLEELQQRVQHLEDAILAMQTRLDQPDVKPQRAAGDAAPVVRHPQLRVRYRSKAKPAEPAASAVAPAPQPALGAQLLSVDMWNGVPSVVVTSGLPSDTRTRTLRPGDTLNGVTLRSADPATGRATFVSGGRAFTLSLGNGG